MRRITIEGTTLQVSRWSFGTASLHHLFSARQRVRVLGAAADAGFSHFDTSPLYGSGLAEVDLGKFLRGQRERFTIATKIGLYPAGGPARSAASLWLHRGLRRLTGGDAVACVDWHITQAERSLDASLGRLRTDFVDVLFLHEPDQALINADEFLRWLEWEHKRGRIRAWGLAGLHVAKLEWVTNGNPLGQVLQVKDSLDRREADTLATAGRKPQFTYGYLSSIKQQHPPTNMRITLSEMLQRNPGGSIIVSTRQIKRLTDFAQAAQAESCG